MFQRLFLLFFFVFLAKTASATHIVGADLTYRWLQNDDYELTLQIYRDCYTGVPDFDTVLWIGVYRPGIQQPYKVLTIDFDYVRDTLPIVLSNPCLVTPPNVCVNTAVFKDTVTLPFSPGGYTIVYQRCCRNQLIKNIQNPTSTGASYICELSEDALNLKNSSAVFRNWPPVAICIHTPIDFDHGASDPNGDSIVYKLCAPLVGATPDMSKPEPPPPPPYEEVDWRPPYGLNNLLGGVPLKIDPKTGFLTGIPNTIGNFVVGICAEEYRNGKLISTSRRDFQYNVADCGEPTAAFFSPIALCDKFDLKFENKSTSSENYQWFFDWPSDLSATSTEKSPTWTFPDTGWYTIALIAFGEKADKCRDTFLQKIHVTNSHIQANFNYSFPDCSAGLTVEVTDLSVDTLFGVFEWNWVLTSNAGFYEQYATTNSTFLIDKPGQYTLMLVSTSGNGCQDTLVEKFNAPIPTLKILNDTLQICPGDEVELNPKADETAIHLWTPATGLDDPTAPNPIASPEISTYYSVTATAPNSPCTAENHVFVEVVDPLSLTLTATPPEIFVGQSSQLQADFPFSATPKWKPDPTLSATNISNPIATPNDTTEYTVTYSLPSGCVITKSILIPVIFPICDEPYVFFPTAFSPNGDGENDALKLEGFYIETVQWMIFDRWGEKVFEADSLDDAWDGSFKGREMPAETYGYYLHVVCPTGAELKKKGNVTLLR